MDLNPFLDTDLPQLYHTWYLKSCIWGVTSCLLNLVERLVPLHSPCLENSMDRGSWRATVHGVIKSRTWLSDYHSLTKVQLCHLPVSELEAFTSFQKTFSCRTCLNFLDFTESWDSLRRSCSLVHHRGHFSVFLFLSPSVTPLTSCSQPGTAFSSVMERRLVCFAINLGTSWNPRPIATKLPLLEWFKHFLSKRKFLPKGYYYYTHSNTCFKNYCHEHYPLFSNSISRILDVLCINVGSSVYCGCNSLSTSRTMDECGSMMLLLLLLSCVSRVRLCATP